MADNTTLNTGSGGDVIATDDIAGVKYQRVKVTFGADGSATDVSTSNPLPVTNGLVQALTNTELRASAIPVSNSALLTELQLKADLTETQPVALQNGTNAIGHINELRAATLSQTVTAATGVAATLTLPAAGAGLFHYITFLEVRLYSTAARTGVATPILVTTTNISNTPTMTFDTAGAIGTSVVQNPFVVGQPMKSLTANTATTIVAPIVTGGIWRITATYFTAV